MAVTTLHPGALAGMADTALLEPDCGDAADPANDEASASDTAAAGSAARSEASGLEDVSDEAPPRERSSFRLAPRHERKPLHVPRADHAPKPQRDDALPPLLPHEQWTLERYAEAIGAGTGAVGYVVRDQWLFRGHFGRWTRRHLPEIRELAAALPKSEQFDVMTRGIEDLFSLMSDHGIESIIPFITPLIDRNEIHLIAVLHNLGLLSGLARRIGIAPFIEMAQRYPDNVEYILNALTNCGWKRLPDDAPAHDIRSAQDLMRAAKQLNSFLDAAQESTGKKNWRLKDIVAAVGLENMGTMGRVIRRMGRSFFDRVKGINDRMRFGWEDFLERTELIARAFGMEACADLLEAGGSTWKALAAESSLILQEYPEKADFMEAVGDLAGIVGRVYMFFSSEAEEERQVQFALRDILARKDLEGLRTRLGLKAMRRAFTESKILSPLEIGRTLDGLAATSHLIETERDLSEVVAQMRVHIFADNSIAPLSRVKRAINRIEEISETLNALSVLPETQWTQTHRKEESGIAWPLSLGAHLAASAPDVARLCGILRKLEDNSDIIPHAGAVDALFDGDRSADVTIHDILVRKFEKSVIVSALFHSDAVIDGDFLAALASVFHIIGSEDDLKNAVALIGNMSNDSRHCLRRLRHLVNSRDDLSSICRIFEQREAVLGITSARSIDPDGVKTLGELPLAGIQDQRVASFVASTGIAALYPAMRRVMADARESVISHLPYVAHVIGDTDSLNEAIWVADSLAAQGTLFALRAIGPRIPSVDQILAFGAAALPIKEARDNAAARNTNLPDCSEICEEFDDWRALAEAFAAFLQYEGPDSGLVHFGSSDPKTVSVDRATLFSAVSELSGMLAYALEQGYADSSFASDRALVLAAIRNHAKAYERASDSLKADAEFRKQAFKLNFNVLEYIGDDADETMKRRHEHIVERLSSLGIDFPHRFNTRTALEVIRNREQLERPDARPIVLFIYNKNDHNKAFEHNQIASLMNRGKRVLYFEIGSAEDARKMNAELKKVPFLAGKNPPVVFGAHSTLFRSSFGTYDPAYAEIDDADLSLDVFKPTEGLAAEIAELGAFLSAGSTVISTVSIEGCGAGGGRERVKNVANMLRRFFPHSYFFAPIVPTYNRYYRYDDWGNIVAVRYAGDGIEYVAEPLEPVAMQEPDKDRPN